MSSLAFAPRRILEHKSTFEKSHVHHAIFLFFYSTLTPRSRRLCGEPWSRKHSEQRCRGRKGCAEKGRVGPASPHFPCAIIFRMATWRAVFVAYGNQLAGRGSAESY